MYCSYLYIKIICVIESIIIYHILEKSNCVVNITKCYYCHGGDDAWCNIKGLMPIQHCNNSVSGGKCRRVSYKGKH